MYEEQLEHVKSYLEGLSVDDVVLFDARIAKLWSDTFEDAEFLRGDSQARKFWAKLGSISCAEIKGRFGQAG